METFEFENGKVVRKQELRLREYTKEEIEEEIAMHEEDLVKLRDALKLFK